MACGFGRSLALKAGALVNLLHHQKAKDLFDEFVRWVMESGRQSKALAGFDRFAVAAAKIDVALSAEPQLSAALVLKTFTAEELRIAGLFSQYLAHIALMPSTEALTDASERRRIDQTLSEVTGPWASEIRAYDEYLRASSPLLKTRTRRNYLRAVVALVKSVEPLPLSALTQDVVEAFCKRNRGYRASLTPWLRYLAVTHPDRQMSIQLRQIKTKGRSLASLGDEVALLLRSITDADTSRYRKTALLSKLIARLYGIPLEQAVALKRTQILDADNGMKILFEEWIDVDPALAVLIRNYLLDEASKEGLLFPGRTVEAALSTAAVDYHWQKIIERESQQLPRY